MVTTQEFIFGLVAVVYGIGGIFLLVYTDRLSKKLKEQQELERNRRASQCRFACEPDECIAPHRDVDQPLLGVVWPPVGDRND